MFSSLFKCKFKYLHVTDVGKFSWGKCSRIDSNENLKKKKAINLHRPNYLMCKIVIVSENTENTCFPCDGLRLHACVEIRATKKRGQVDSIPHVKVLSKLFPGISCISMFVLVVILVIMWSWSSLWYFDHQTYNLVSIKYNHTRHSQVFLIVSGSDPRTASNNFQLWRAQVDPKLPSCENVYKNIVWEYFDFENVLIVRMFIRILCETVLMMRMISFDDGDG